MDLKNMKAPILFTRDNSPVNYVQIDLANKAYPIVANIQKLRFGRIDIRWGTDGLTQLKEMRKAGLYEFDTVNEDIHPDCQDDLLLFLEGLKDSGDTLLNFEELRRKNVA